MDAKLNSEEKLCSLDVDVDSLRCRYYENRYPDADEVVMCNVTEISEMGAYVTLLEYDNIQGMILLSELSRRRIRSVNKLVRVNRIEIVVVVRVDAEKGYVDLSKRRVDPEDVGRCEDRYNKAKAVHGVLRHVAEMKGLRLDYLYQTVGWPLYRKYGHAYHAFKSAISGDGSEDVFSDLKVSPGVKDAIISHITRKLAPQPVKIRADIEVTCFTYEGIDAIKEALSLAESHPMSTPRHYRGSMGLLPGAAQPELEQWAPAVKVKLIAPPLYVISCITMDKDLGIALLNQAIERVQACIRSKGGDLQVIMAPKAVSQREETELQAMLERLAREQEGEEEEGPDEPDD